MSIAFLFSGQGSQQVGMGIDLASTCVYCNDSIYSANDALGFPLTETMANGPEEKLALAMFTQPAILSVSVAQARHLMALDIKPDMLAGHSVGVWSALVIADALDYHTALRLVSERGRLMQETVPVGEGAMMAIVGLDREEVYYEACRQAGSCGVVNVACHNCPRQTVISGARTAVDYAAELCEEKGGGTVELVVSAPIHCQLMSPMMPEFQRLVQDTIIGISSIPVIDDTTGRPFSSTDATREAMVTQAISPVLFDESLHYLIGLGIDHFIQCGPGRNLLNYAKRVAPNANLLTFEQVTSNFGVTR